MHTLFCYVNKSRQFLVIVATLAIVLSSLFLLKQCNRNVEPGDIPQEPDTTDIQKPVETVPVPDEKEVKDTVAPEPKSDQDDSAPAPEVKGHQVKLKVKNYYQAPLDGPLFLSGTFGELRGNHFHAGLDIRTGGVEGAKVKAAANGYVSRIKVSTGGYGKALYIQHPNGTTTVYGHLQKFSGPIQDAVIKKQYRDKTYEFDWYVPAGQLKVKKGEVIAISGNTGGSGGPHLHFEIRDARGNTVNPLLYDIKVSDKINPTVSSCRVYAIDRKHYEKYGTYGSIKVPGKGATIELEPGTYGIGANWVDYFSDKLNRLGINYAEVEVNGKTIFTQTIEDFAFSQGRYINKHIDYWRYAETGVRYVKMFKDVGNALHFYKGKGEIKLSEGEVLDVKIVVTDFSGKSSSYGFKLKGNKAGKEPNEGGMVISNGQRCTPSGSTTLKSANARVVIPGGSLYNTTYMSLTESDPTGKACSPMIRVNNHHVPLHKSATISIKIPAQYEASAGKLAMMSYDRKARSSSYEGGKVSGGYITETSKSLGMYYLTLDTVAPTVTPLSLNRFLSFRVDDLTSGVGKYNCTIDGKWVLLEYEPKSRKLFGDIPSTYGSGKHELVLVVYDQVGNKTEIKKTLTI